MNRFFNYLCFSIVAGAPMVQPLHADNNNWNGTTTDFNEPANWTGTPVSGNLFYVDNPALPFPTISVDVAWSPAVLWVGTVSNSQLKITGGNSTISNLVAGYTGLGVGTITMTGGNVSSPANGLIGYDGGTGIMTMSGSSTWITTGFCSVNYFDGGVTPVNSPSSLTLNESASITAGYYAAAFNGGTITLNGGSSLTSTTSDVAALAGSTLNMHSTGTISAGDRFYALTNCTIDITSGTVSVVNLVSADDNSTMSISSAIVTSTSGSIEAHNGSTITISNGSTISAATWVAAFDGSTITISDTSSLSTPVSNVSDIAALNSSVVTLNSTGTVSSGHDIYATNGSTMNITTENVTASNNIFADGSSFLNVKNADLSVGMTFYASNGSTLNVESANVTMVTESATLIGGSSLNMKSGSITATNATLPLSS